MQSVAGGRVSSNSNDIDEQQQQQQQQQVVNGGGVVMRKGPWMAEEDEILLEYVRKHGPRDWSSIRSKGLLPRTGKSCRLRWVNKLKPDLKTGCKFSPEEERIVIDLQARFGNKWARIATYLPGRTDNDVKNFWSTRQKRLARILQTPLPSKSNRNQPKVVTAPNEVPTFEVACLDLIPFGEESCTGQCNHSSFVESQDSTKTYQIPELLNQQSLVVNPQDSNTLPLPPDPPLEYWEPPQFHFDNLPNPEVDFPLFLEGQDLVPGFGDMSCHLPEGLPFFSLGVGKQNIKTGENSGMPDSFFDDFPADMFDYLEPPPPPPPPPPTSSAAW